MKTGLPQVDFTSSSARQCDFEEPGLCGWTPYTPDGEVTYSGAWLWRNGSSEGAQPGPSSDHTYGTAYGHLLQASGEAGQLAGIISHPVVLSRKGEHCFRLFHQRYGGNTTGVLKVRCHA